MRDKGTTILLTTHYLEEAEELCDQIAIINKGEVVTCQPTEELLRSLDHKEFIVTVSEELTEVPKRLSRFKVELQNKHMLVFRVPPSQVPVEDLLQAVQAFMAAAQATAEKRGASVVSDSDFAAVMDFYKKRTARKAGKK